jgi:hypothetical protein
MQRPATYWAELVRFRGERKTLDSVVPEHENMEPLMPHKLRARERAQFLLANFPIPDQVDQSALTKQADEFLIEAERRQQTSLKHSDQKSSALDAAANDYFKCFFEKERARARRVGSVRSFMRFRVEKMATKAWMVWDTATQTVAVIDGVLAAGLSYNEAVRIGDELNEFHRQLTRMKATA